MEGTLKQYDGCTVTPKDDAILYDTIIGESGIITGGTITSMGGNTIHITETIGIIKGRMFVIAEGNMTVQNSQDTKKGRIYIHMDLSAGAPLPIMSVTGTTLPKLVQNENANIDNGIYEIELATYTTGGLSISNLKTTYNTVTKKVSGRMDGNTLYLTV